MNMEKGSSGEHSRASEKRKMQRSSGGAEGHPSHFEKKVGRTSATEKQKISRRQAERIRLTSAASEMLDQLIATSTTLSAVTQRDQLSALALLEKDFGRTPSPELADRALALAMELESPKDKALALLKAGYVRNQTDPESAKELFQETRAFVQTQSFDTDTRRDSNEKVWLLQGIARAFVRIGDSALAEEVVDQDIARYAPEKTFDTLLILAEEETLHPNHRGGDKPLEGKSLLQQTCDRLIAFDDQITAVIEQGDEESGEALFFRHSSHSHSLQKATQLCIQAGDLQGARMLLARIPSYTDQLQSMRSLSQAYASRGWVDESLAVIMDQIEVADLRNERDKKNYRDEQLRMAISRLSRNGYTEQAYELVDLVQEDKKRPRLKDIFVQLGEGAIADFSQAIDQLEARDSVSEKAELLAVLTHSYVKAQKSHESEATVVVHERLAEQMHLLADQREEISDPEDKAWTTVFLAQTEAVLSPEETRLLNDAEALDLSAVQDNDLNFIWLELAKAQGLSGKTEEAVTSFTHINPRYLHSQWSSLVSCLPLDQQSVATTIASYITQGDDSNKPEMFSVVAKEQASRGEDCFFALEEARTHAESLIGGRFSAVAKVARLYIQFGMSLHEIENLSERDRTSILTSGVPGIEASLERLNC